MNRRPWEADTDASVQGVTRGWVIEEINGEPVEPNKKAVLKAATAAMKAAAGPLKIGFRAPLRDDLHCCSECQKWLREDEFGAGQLGGGRGQARSCSCTSPVARTRCLTSRVLLRFDQRQALKKQPAF